MAKKCYNKPMQKIILSICLLGLTPIWASSGGETGYTLIYNIALCIVAAGVFGLIMKVLRQPMLLGYLIAGVVIGPIGFGFISSGLEVNSIAELGLILLLFMIGLEINLNKMISAGKMVVIPGLIQFPLTVFIAFFLLKGMGLSILDPALNDIGILYLSLALGLGSTMIAVKLLYEKHELDTLPGRITLGILVFQDLWAITVLAIQPSLGDFQIMVLANKALWGFTLVGSTLLASKYLLPRLFQFSAKQPELLMILSLAWCFMVSLIANHPAVGLNMEMGALVAGISLATFPYSVEVYNRVVSIRDFFMILFFVALGMQIPFPTFNVIFISFILAQTLIFLRVFAVFIPLFILGAGQRTSTKSTLNLSQTSEFSLVIGAIGIQLGHIPDSTLGYIIWTFCILAVTSTYTIQSSDYLERVVRSAFNLLGYREHAKANDNAKQVQSRPVVILGYHKIAAAFVEEIIHKHEHLKDQILVIDYNPVSKISLEREAIPCVYGDVAHSGTLEHAGIENAQLVICPTTDTYLNGTNNLKLSQILKQLCPNSRIILTAENESQARVLYSDGADYVLQPFKMAGASLVPTVLTALNGNLTLLKDQDLEWIEQSFQAKESRARK